SSLAHQWSVEDGEEQERERRRRHRQLSSTSETKEEESSSSTVQKVTSQTSNRVDNSLEAKLLNLENSALKNEKIEPVSVNKLEGRRVRRRAEFLNNIKQEKKILVSTKKFEKEPPEESPTSPPESSKDEGTAEKCKALIQQKDVLEESPQIQSQKKEEIAEEKHEAMKHVKDLKIDEDQVFREEEKVPSVCESQRLAVTQNEVASQEPQRVSWERKSISRLEVKIQPRAKKFTDPAVATPASEAPQVVPRKERQEDALNRSASMRLPASTVKLEEKLERYTSAVQRAGSIKVSSPIRRNFQPASEGVASKRSIFEATIPVQSEPPTFVRKVKTDLTQKSIAGRNQISRKGVFRTFRELGTPYKGVNWKTDLMVCEGNPRCNQTCYSQENLPPLKQKAWMSWNSTMSLSLLLYYSIELTIWQRYLSANNAYSAFY
ncbi:hypothetical protein E2320_009848, partial [Naja naja]